MNKKYTYLIVVFLILASFIAFGRIMGNDFINFDDDKYITENYHIKSGINADSIKWAFTDSQLEYWHPLTWLSIMLDWRLFGANASGHHLVSLLWHIGSAILIFLFLSKITGSLWPSAFAAALFALHPLRVESVAWAAERKDVLSVFFGMATLYAYAYYVEKPQISKYFICLILFVLSLMSKPMLVTLPCVMLLLDYWPLGRLQKASTPEIIPVLVDKRAGKKKNKKLKVESSVDKKITKPVQSGRQLIGNLLWEKAPFFLLALSLGIMGIWQAQEDSKFSSLQQIPFSDRIMNAIVSYVSYLWKTFWPVDLAVFYPYQFTLPLWQFFGALLILLLISAVVILHIRKLPFLFVGWFWYLGTLFPVIGLMQAGDQAMADRYTYFPSIGIAIMMAYGLANLIPKEKMRKIIIIPVVIILAALTFLTWQQCGYWKNSASLFNHALRSTKDNYLAHTKVGVASDAEGKTEEAISHYRAALRINPNHAYAYSNLGKTFEEQGNIEEAMNYFQQALVINPNLADVHNRLGNILDKYFNKYDQAIYHYQKALIIDPSNPGIHFNLGNALCARYFNSFGKNGTLKEAFDHFREAIYLKPDYEDAERALRRALELEQKLKN